MKIGVLTYHCVPNFGAQLQAISTVGYLRRLGHEPIVLHWYPQDLEEMYSKRIPAEQVQMQMQFAERNIPLTKLCRTEDDVIKEIEHLQLDAVFAGSDALFKYVPESDRIVFSKRRLRFVRKKIYSVEDLGNVFQGGFLSKTSRKIKAVAFSVSSQNCPYFRMNENEKRVIKECMSNYSKISTRDEWTRDMVQAITGKTDIDITPDPVFAFNQNNYLMLPEKSEILRRYSLPENYVLFSFWRNKLPKGYLQNMAKLFLQKGLAPIALPVPETLNNCGLDYTINLPLSPIDWYALIKYSKGYIGERMHPIVVALHNAVPFFNFDSYGTFKKSLWGLRKQYITDSSKTYHILKSAELDKYRYSYLDKSRLPCADEVVQMVMDFPVDYCKSFAEQQQQRYNFAMKKILIAFEG